MTVIRLSRARSSRWRKARSLLSKRISSKAANKLAKAIIRKDSTFVTILYGEGATEEQAGEVEKYIHAKFGDDLEVAVINGGQPVYYFILSAE